MRESHGMVGMISFRDRLAQRVLAGAKGSSARGMMAPCAPSGARFGLILMCFRQSVIGMFCAS
jgi:hypothetical protein